MFKLGTLASVGLLVLMASPAFAQGNSNGNGNGNGNGNANGRVVGVPGPIAGVGLPILAVAGGYIWIRRQKQKNQR
jgi:hypothetical protein